MDNQQSKILAHSHPAIERLLRHRWAIAGVGGFALLSMMTAFALAPSDSNPRIQTQTVLEQLNAPYNTLIAAENAEFLREERIQRADTLSSLIARLGISDPAAQAFLLSNPQTKAIARQLRPGKVVTAKTTVQGELIAFYFPLNGKDSLLVVEKSAGSFVAREQILKLDAQIAIKSGEIRNSLFGATDAAGIPDAIALQLAEIFSGDIDFHRDLRKGDRFSLVYETLTHQGQPVRSGRILSAEFLNDQKLYSAYWFQPENGHGGYYTAEGKNLRKAFLRSPLEFSRVTSGFTNARFHPVLHIMRAHKGVDYAAPIGTRIRSVADGTVEFAGQQGGYGNMVILKHQGAYTTAYGHMNGFASGIKKGTRISQGETIGFVGKTGLASGPHLHYEFRVNGTQVNPLAATLPAAIPLEASQIARFKATTEPLRGQLKLAKQINLASAK